MILQVIVNLILYGLLSIISIEDIREHKIRNKWLGLILINGGLTRVIIDGKIPGIQWLYVALFFLLFLTVYLLGNFGAGDVKLITVLALYQPPIQYLYSLLLAMTIAVIYMKKEKVKQAALGPFISLGFVMTQVMVCFLLPIIPINR